MKLKVEHLALKSLVPYAKNSRTHTPDQVAQIARSIREFGFTNPVLVDAAGGIIAGHGRVLAAAALSMEAVPCIRLAHLTEAQKRAYVIADNKLALNAGWDLDILRGEMEELLDAGFDLELTGFSLEEIGDLEPAAGGTEGRTDPDAAPPVEAEAVSQHGDVWILGNHRVMCGDSTSAEALRALCDGARVDMWLTDPPYNVAIVGGNHSLSPEERKRRGGKAIENDKMPDAQFRQFLRDACAAADGVMRPGAAFYIWFADVETYNFTGAIADVGWPLRQMLIWKKNTLVMGRKDYHFQHEPCLYGWKPGAAHLWASDRKQTTVLEFDRPSRSADHPTMKPVALFEYQLLNNTKGGDVVLDSFGGSGTTLIAAEKNGRVARLMELDPLYVDVEVRRWQEFTGKEARHAATGASFAEVAAKPRALEPEAA